MTDPSPVNASSIQRLVLCFDGTWNTPEDTTNVARLYAAVGDAHAECPEQLKFYDEGVGTTLRSWLTGGLFGLGLDQNILEGYAWLVNQFVRAPGPSRCDADGEEFDPGPDIFLFGFSRGAFTARSLAGLLNRCGLPRRDLLKDPATPDSPVVRAAWELYRRRYTGSGEARRAEEWRTFRHEHCWTVKVKFLGVWDTVGALGIPNLRSAALPVDKGLYEFHDVRLGRIVERAYHAVAIDEQREDFRVTLWDGVHPGADTWMEQRWFPGAHSNVGGGYEDDTLPDPPLRWIAEQAVQAGLQFNDEFTARLSRVGCNNRVPIDFELRGDEHLGVIRDSYAEFAYGLYHLTRAVTLRGRYYRGMLTTGANETIDPTAHKRWAADPTYRPRNFAYAGRPDPSSTDALPVTG